MKRILFTLFICTAMAFGLSVSLAQTHQSFFYSSNRLSSSLITAITQTDDGLLWVGTENGLNRFDGYSFTIIRSLGDSRVVRPMEVSTLYTAPDGRLWVGMARGLSVYDRGADDFSSVVFPDSLEPRIMTLSTLPDGSIAAGTGGYGTFVVDTATLEARPQTGSIPSGDDAFITSNDLTPELQAMAPQDVQLTCVVSDKAGNRYVGTRSNGLMWVPKGETTMRPLAVSVEDFDLSRSRVQALFVDNQGNLWVGCQQKGLLMIALQRRPLFSVWNFAARHLEAATCVSAIAPRADGGVWCMVQGDGVYGFTADGQSVVHPASPSGVETIMRDKGGNYWLGTTGGVWAFNPALEKVSLLVPFNGLRVNAIMELDERELAVSTYGSGLSVVEKSTGRVLQRMTMHDTDTLGRGGLANDWIFCMDKDTRGRLWIGTSAGVCCYDPSTESFATEGWRVLMEHEKCTALDVLSSGDVIMAFEQGVFRWSRIHGLQPEPGMEPIRGRTISYIIEDNVGDIWFSTNEGIWQWNQKEKALVAYVGTYGLRQREFVQGAGLRTDDGRLFFGTAEGVVSFVPDSLRRAHEVPGHVHLTAFVIAGENANMLTQSNGKRVMEQPVGDCKHFSLSYVDAIFRMEFSLLDFVNADGVSFEYRMSDEWRWQQTEKGENAITFSHLAPGTYEVQVRAISGGAYTPVETYVIEVRPPWWRSTWAYIIYSLLLLAGAAMAAYAYQRHVQYQLNQEKLHFLMEAINTKDVPLTLDEMKRAIGTFVQSRKRQRNLYGDSVTMADRMEVPEVKGNDELLMERVVQSVNRHLSDSEFSVEQLCTEAAISRAHLHRKMKEMTGLSVTEFIRNIRLEQAARLLREQKLNITQVAYTVGFSNLGYFSTIFRKHFGVSPRDFVKDLTPES